MLFLPRFFCCCSRNREVWISEPSTHPPTLEPRCVYWYFFLLLIKLISSNQATAAAMGLSTWRIRNAGSQHACTVPPQLFIWLYIAGLVVHVLVAAGRVEEAPCFISPRSQERRRKSSGGSVCHAFLFFGRGTNVLFPGPDRIGQDRTGQDKAGVEAFRCVVWLKVRTSV